MYLNLYSKIIVSKFKIRFLEICFIIFLIGIIVSDLTHLMYFCDLINRLILTLLKGSLIRIIDFRLEKSYLVVYFPKLFNYIFARIFTFRF